jgi:hypothetical protein
MTDAEKAGRYDWMVRNLLAIIVTTEMDYLRTRTRVTEVIIRDRREIGAPPLDVDSVHDAIGHAMASNPRT